MTMAQQYLEETQSKGGMEKVNEGLRELMNKTALDAQKDREEALNERLKKLKEKATTS
jgi:hypothetical protein